MKEKMKRGFTLIELLVVVLIIGILAAIALPQYERAVKKSRVAEAKINLSTLVRASDVACLADPNYNGDMSALDIDVQDSAHWIYENSECVHANGHCGCAWYATSQDDDIRLLGESKEYQKALEYDLPELSCSEMIAREDTRWGKICPKYGFTKYNEVEEWYNEL